MWKTLLELPVSRQHEKILEESNLQNCSKAVYSGMLKYNSRARGLAKYACKKEVSLYPGSLECILVFQGQKIIICYIETFQ